MEESARRGNSQRVRVEQKPALSFDARFASRPSLGEGLRLHIAYNGVVGSWTGRSLSALRRRERKVRTPQSSVPDNVREAGFKPG